MFKRIGIYIIVSLLMGATYFFIVKNIIFPVAIFLIFILLFMLFVEIKYRKFNIVKRKTEECVGFINNFVITMSINNSVSSTLASMSGGFSDELTEQMSLISHLTDEEKVYYLENYFQSPLYCVFTKLLKQYLEEGGDIVDSSRMLIFDSHLTSEKMENFLSISRVKIFQFSYMWLICFGILLAVQLFMGEYYLKIQTMNYFPYGVGLFFIVFGLSLALILSHAFNLDFINKGVKYDKT